MRLELRGNGREPDAMRRRVRREWVSLAGLVIAQLAHAPMHPSAYAADPPVRSELVKIELMSLFVAEPGAETQLAIRIVPPDSLPNTAYVRIRGLPATVVLSDGHAVAPGVWSVPLIGLPALKVVVPKGVSGRSELAVSVLTVDGQILAEAKSALLVAQVNLRAPAVEPPKVALNEPAPAAPPAETLVRPQRPLKAEMVPSFPQPSGATTIPTPMPAPPAAAPPLPEPPKTEPKQQIAVVTPSPPPAAPAVTSDARTRNERMIEQGDKALAQGNIATARQFYLRAADAGSGAAALKLAQSYDPAELAKLRVQGLVGDVAEARRWYEKARDLGEPDAAGRLKTLSGK